MLCRSRWCLQRADMKTHAEYVVSYQRPDSIMVSSCGRDQWRLRAGFSRRAPLPSSAIVWSCFRVQEHAALSTSTRLWFLGSSPGKPSGCASERSGLGPGRPSAKVLGISLALDFVEQSRAAAVKAADRIGASSACCLTGLDRSCPGSNDQSMGSTLQPQNRNAFARGILGPHMRSTINGHPPKIRC